jgi:hypothetical protein
MRSMEGSIVESRLSVRRGHTVASICVAAVLMLGACGDDDGACDYLFADVPTKEECGAGRVTPDNPATGLQAEFDCANAVYTAGTEGCQLISCQECADVDADFDGDVDDDM